MSKIDYLTPIEALTIHAHLLKKYGGPESTVDMGLLESALFRPQTGYYPDLISQATALFESLIMNHPFTDGNKRAGFGITDVFLRINGYSFIINGDQIYKKIIDLLESGSFNYDTLLPWMHASVEKLSRNNSKS